MEKWSKAWQTLKMMKSMKSRHIRTRSQIQNISSPPLEHSKKTNLFGCLWTSKQILMKRFSTACANIFAKFVFNFAKRISSYILAACSVSRFFFPFSPTTFYHKHKSWDFLSITNKTIFESCIGKEMETLLKKA